MDINSCAYEQGSYALAALMKHSTLFVGTDEATTCVGLVIRNKQNGMTSVAHMDSTNIVDMGLSQMLSLVVGQNLDAYLEVHLVGGFEDVSPNYANSRIRSKSSKNLEGYSYPLCAKIVESMCIRQEKFHIRTFFVLGHNTRRDSKGNAYPIFNGLAVETSTGSVTPSCFGRTSRCLDEIVRRIRVTASYEDPSWNGKLLEKYDTQIDQFRIAPCHCSLLFSPYLLMPRALLSTDIGPFAKNIWLCQDKIFAIRKSFPPQKFYFTFC
ncbi:hypothetical protein FH972_026329 [Carpinus fangiana]|uniref:Protein N-terminal asparagine amidohydrolase n=1 Tax=Carpinus fangiana TaxID=176857 RepID=A0A5N6L3M1_9ROSI|nr:hypothetical protein FH972_026329 [Carpinus fangiana]